MSPRQAWRVFLRIHPVGEVSARVLGTPLHEYSVNGLKVVHCIVGPLWTRGSSSQVTNNESVAQTLRRSRDLWRVTEVQKNREDFEFRGGKALVRPR
jgi:hypothetical protein